MFLMKLDIRGAFGFVDYEFGGGGVAFRYRFTFWLYY